MLLNVLYNTLDTLPFALPQKSVLYKMSVVPKTEKPWDEGKTCRVIQNHNHLIIKSAVWEKKCPHSNKWDEIWKDPIVSLMRENTQLNKGVLCQLYFQQWSSLKANIHSSWCLDQRAFECPFFSCKGPVYLDWDMGHSRSKESLFKDILFWEN